MINTAFPRSFSLWPDPECGSGEVLTDLLALGRKKIDSGCGSDEAPFLGKNVSSKDTTPTALPDAK